MDECDVVSFEKDFPDRPSCLRLHVKFFSLIQNEVHVFVKSDDDSFDPHLGVLVQPNLHSCFLLEITENQVDGLHHHLLYLVATFERHLRTENPVKHLSRLT
ncbi:hypothetical protein RvY_08869 [Ramazzottius varieornatus]|uniref:Uncharacterized protein n=1 Tax=Ramazzottius varieornatus TaxID=947166 RepID=A0A1D1V7F1_RAMVA|nr:hypothetical protein RvY_08869 [Ramazzottius varieornatus]